MLADVEDIQNFWFYEVGPDRWFVPDPTIDEAVRARYLETHEKAALEELPEWETTPEGTLALLLLLDPFPRRMFRGSARAYATDDIALELARRAIINHFDDRIDRTFKLFFYLPFVHSESLGDQRLATFYIRERTKDPAWIDSANWRLETIKQFGHFPHRNAVLGRVNTPDEEIFLADHKVNAGPKSALA